MHPAYIKSIIKLQRFPEVEMEVQYVYDEEGRQTGVIVPIGLWNRISHMAVNVQAEKNDWNPSKYRGMYKNLKIDVKEESKALRDEWTRMSKDIYIRNNKDRASWVEKAHGGGIYFSKRVPKSRQGYICR